MLLEWLTPALLALLVAITLWIAFRRGDALTSTTLGPAVALHIRAETERLEREVRDEVARSAHSTRQEVAQGSSRFQQTFTAQHGEFTRTQNERLAQLAEQQAATLKLFADSLGEQLRALSRANDERMAEVRATVETKLGAIQADNEKKLEQIRMTVDEKLHATLEQRLGESFRQVAERLEQVHSGLGEMRTIAKDVGSLSRVLNNVKTRGILGEVQLSALLDEVFTIGQYDTQVETVPGSNARVDAAVKFPGRREDGQPVWLPIDCKFPREDYERLLEAQDAADKPAVEAAGRAIEVRLRAEARTIRAKYLSPPHTTDFGIMFLPTEGLYAEALRRPGLVESLQRDHKVMMCGPTTLLATLSSFQMGFRTLALEKRSSEVRELLGAVKTEFGKFGQVLAQVKKQASTVVTTIGDAETRTRQMTRALQGVEAAPEPQTQMLLPGQWAEPGEAASIDE